MSRAQQGAEQFLAAAGLGEEALSDVSDAIVKAALTETEGARPQELPARPEPVAAAPEPRDEAPREPQEAPGAEQDEQEKPGPDAG
jgi:hypothetical protein